MCLAQNWHILGALVADRLYGGPNNPHLYYLAPYFLDPIFSLPCSTHSTIDTLVSLLFFQQVRHSPASDPLHWLLLLPKVYFIYPHD